MMKKNSKLQCPYCQSNNVADIMYGEPVFNDELDRALKNGELYLGGCCYYDDSPKYHCNKCGKNFPESEHDPDYGIEFDMDETENEAYNGDIEEAKKHYNERSQNKDIKKPTTYEQFKELLRAIEQGEKTKVYFLLKENIDVNTTNEDGRTPLMAAITTDDLDMVRIVVEGGADLELKARDKETALLYACRVTNNLDIIKYLIKCGADKNARNQYNDTALFIAAEYNANCKICEYLIKEQKYDIDDQGDIYQYTPLMAAARHNNIDVVNVLIDNGANLYAQDKGKWPPVFQAATHEKDDPKILIKLLGLAPEQLFIKIGKYNIRKIARESGNPNICEALNSLINIYSFFSKMHEKKSDKQESIFY